MGNEQRAVGRRVGSRNKLILIAWIALVLAMGAVFANLTRKALWVRAVTSSEFSQYVRDHHIGTAEVSDDASGMQQDFCLLHVSQPIPKAQLESQLLALLAEYHSLDGGRSLTVEYDEPGTSKKVVQGDAVFDPATHTVRLTLYAGSQPRVVTESVDWANGDAS